MLRNVDGARAGESYLHPRSPNQVEMRQVEIAVGLLARLYIPPHAEEPLPLLVYLHGGGWVAGSVATHDPFCRLLSGAAEVVIASIEYRMAPEHPYPAAVNDTVTAVQWAHQHAGDWSGDVTRLASAAIAPAPASRQW